MNNNKSTYQEEEKKHCCSLCGDVYRPLICFKDGFCHKPPPLEIIISDEPYGWSYFEDFNKQIPLS